MPAFIVHKCPEFIEKLKDFPPTLKRSSLEPFLPRVGSDSNRVSAKKDFCETLNRFEITFVSICLLQSMTLHENRVKVLSSPDMNPLYASRMSPMRRLCIERYSQKSSISFGHAARAEFFNYISSALVLSGSLWWMSVSHDKTAKNINILNFDTMGPVWLKNLLLSSGSHK